ncbi:hypothetical protein AQUCO_02000621v1 [Aquilegia coerulea]|uniref:Uncharacterized protein n=1 Tax=Aquilegia coerulea TaxID=218851 RepID=A0A2G5DIL7_AQUCA|nr:hypothetical protein AQUCO_02000621v1 [Aquilegia coerulea]
MGKRYNSNCFLMELWVASQICLGSFMNWLPLHLKNLTQMLFSPQHLTPKLCASLCLHTSCCTDRGRRPRSELICRRKVRNRGIKDIGGSGVGLRMRKKYNYLAHNLGLPFEFQRKTFIIITKQDVGKISRRVSLMHYAEPRELEDPRQFYERSYGSSATRSSRQSGLSYVTPSRSSRPKGSLFGTGESSKRSKKRHDNQPVEYRSDYSHDSTGVGLSSGVSSLG